MLYLQTTQRARDVLGLGREPLGEPQVTESKLGNWLLNVVPISGGEAFLFMSSRSLLSFPMVLGRHKNSFHDMPAFLAHGIKQLAQTMKPPVASIARLLEDFEEVAVCKAADRSLLGLFSAIASDYFHRVDAEGGISKANIGAVVFEVNSTPRQSLGYKTPFEVTLALLSGSDA